LKEVLAKYPSDNKAQAEVLIRQNGELVEELFRSKAWVEIVKPLLDEAIAGVSGRFTNGRFWHGTLTQKWDGNTSVAMAFYQKALMEFYNHLHDFIVAKDKMLADKKAEKEQAEAPLVNPMMEDYESDN
jgi:hypothetical protein